MRTNHKLCLIYSIFSILFITACNKSESDAKKADSKEAVAQESQEEIVAKVNGKPISKKRL